MSSDIISSLNSPAKEYAERAAAEGLTLTSGRRDLKAQAHAMATNVAKSITKDGDYDWVEETYVHRAAEEACQKWIDEHHEEAADVEQCAEGLYSVLSNLSDDDLGHLSYHLSGNAFDCHPDGSDEHKKFLEDLVAEAKEDGRDAKLLTHEGRLTVWHFQVE
jgi:hypothetical protein